MIETAVNGFATESTSSAETRSQALFGQGIWHVTDKLDLSAGLRFTHERRSGRFEQHHAAGRSLATLTPAEAVAARSIRDNASSEAAFTALVEDDDLSGMLAVSYLTPIGITYLSASRGHKAGGLNIGNLPEGTDPTVRPETVQNFELGAKSRLFGDSTILNIAIFHTTISDYQTSVIQGNSPGGNLFEYISNIEEARSRGFEADMAWSVSRRFALSAGFAYTAAEYVSYPGGPCPPEVSPVAARCDLSGQPLAGSPRRSWTLALDGEELLIRNMEFYWRVDYSGQSALFTDVSNSRYSMIEGYSLSNLSVGVRRSDRRWDLRFWIRNLADEDFFQITRGFSTGLIGGVPGAPRTIGVTLRGQF